MFISVVFHVGRKVVLSCTHAWAYKLMQRVYLDCHAGSVDVENQLILYSEISLYWGSSYPILHNHGNVKWGEM